MPTFIDGQLNTIACRVKYAPLLKMRKVTFLINYKEQCITVAQTVSVRQYIELCKEIKNANIMDFVVRKCSNFHIEIFL